MVEVVTGEARVMFVDNSAPTSVKVTFPFSWFGQIEESIRQRVYIETTIPSFYYEVRTEPEMIARRNWTQAWWDSRRQAYR